MLCDYFLSSVTEGVQPNAEESGTGLQEDSHGGDVWVGMRAHTHAHALTNTHTPPSPLSK